MRKHRKLLALFMAAAMTVTSVWPVASVKAEVSGNNLRADGEGYTTYYSQDYNSLEAADWATAAADRYAVSLADKGSGDKYIKVAAVSNGNNGTTITSPNFDAAAGPTVMTFDLQLTGGDNQTSLLSIFDASSVAILTLEQTAAKSTVWKINGDANTTVDLKKATWYSVKLVWANERTYLLITDAAGQTVFGTDGGIKEITNLSAGGGVKNMTYLTKRYYAAMAIDNIVIADGPTGFEGVVSHIVKVKVTDEDGNEISSKDMNVNEGESFTPTYDETFNLDGYKYTYVSGAITLENVTDDSQEIVLVYSKRELVKTTATLKYKAGETDIGDKSTEVVEDDIVYMAYPKYILQDGIVYATPQSKDAAGYFRKQLTATQQDQEVVVEYTAETGKGAYYSEGETLGEVSAVPNADIRCSDGACYTVPTEGIYVVTLGEGTYTAEVAAWGSAGDTYTVNAGEDTVASVTTTGSLAVEKGKEFTLTEETGIKVTGTQLKITGLDYILIRAKQIAATSVTITSESEDNTITDRQQTISLRAAMLPVFATDTVVWSSSDEEIATVADGVVTPTGTKNGKVMITATAGSVTDSVEVTVNIDTTSSEGTETPGTETPGTETPGTETPGTETPGTETPGTETPGTETPGTETPGTETPGTETPGTETPGTETPGTETPGTETPGTETPGTETPGTETPGTETPGTETPGTETPGTETPGTETPGTETPGTETKGSETPGNSQTGSSQAPAAQKVGAKFTVSKNNYKVTKSGKAPTVEFTGTKNTGKTIKIPDTVKDKNGIVYKVTTVGKNAVKGNKKVTGITVGKNVTNIKDNAFANCTKLTKVTINSTVLATIGKTVFSGDKKLGTITIKSAKLKKVGKNALKDTKKNITIKVPKKQVADYTKLFKGKGQSKYKVKK